MPSTNSPNKGYELQATGENDGTWGVKLNAAVSIIDLNLGGRNNLSVAGSTDVTLTAAQARSLYQHYTGVLTGNINVIFPATQGGDYIIKNATSGSFTLTVKPSGGTGIEIPQGQTVRVFMDPDQTSAMEQHQPRLSAGGSLAYSSGLLRRAALTGDVTASADGNATTLGITTTRGDIITRGAASNGRLALGATDTILASDGTDAVYRTLTALMDAILGSTNGFIANRAGGVWVGSTTTTLGLALLGKQTVGVPASAMAPTTTAGCAAIASAESSTNDINYKYLAFDASTEEHAWFWIPTPKSYNASTVTMRAVWTHGATVTNFGVVWEFEILSLTNDDAIDTAVGTAVTVTDTGGTTGDFYISDESAAITPSNSVAKQDWLYVQVSRKAADAADTLAVDAHLIGVELYYTTDAGNDA